VTVWPWILGGAGVITVVALGSGKAKAATPPPQKLPPSTPGPGPGPGSVRPPPAEKPPPGAVRTATIGAPRGVNVRAFPPSVNARILARLPQGSRVGIMEVGPPLPPTAGMQEGWQKIRTSRGVDGYVALRDAEGARILHYDDEPAEEIFTAGIGERRLRRSAPGPASPEAQTSAAIYRRLQQYIARGAHPTLVASVRRRYEEALDRERARGGARADYELYGQYGQIPGDAFRPDPLDPYRSEESLYRGYAPMRF